MASCSPTCSAVIDLNPHLSPLAGHQYPLHLSGEKTEAHGAKRPPQGHTGSGRAGIRAHPDLPEPTFPCPKRTLRRIAIYL